ncbi:MAG TPA: amidohydrolase [Algoriphagus sp.]|jgi:aminobenzoyl-glutamate utilization protein B|uniref:amidohydrolase n=2 Tax=Algoriphagus TaxID=246875 RepID=UPI000C3CFE51|nr:MULTISPECIES: amidohydrolase [unclassified Algoriphagus]MAL12593.1 amidohydrolase [Algoriphagus sp.]MAN88199.1 amidohydrolase [Algoriphagus sp.]HAS59197.1 amidohydrolase [Algoriphagus sp.]HAZ23665.1 amidohydrolase [Algoriphagus sp.]HCB45175.1 amidohydrolase [Algoriphagus sp.]|tara:strand:- start:1586 stop:3022 length:1437 start_codon:yes stop_codon:yes gene_type:complete
MISKRKTYILLFALLWANFSLAQEKTILNSLDQKAEFYGAISKLIWSNPELGYLETESSELLQKTLKDAGFSVKTGVADIPTAFVAEFGSGAPVVGIMAEFDALPGVSQKAVPFREPVVEGGAGHACGHHLFGTASVAAGIAVKDWMQQNKITGTIRVYGTPAEEGGGGKVYMARAGLMEDVDAMLHWHPGSKNDASASSSLANISTKFRFYGEASHAAAAPDRGKSALDGVEAMNFMVNLLREHVPQETRMHYVITRGGEAPNVVPAFAESYHYVRHPDARVVKEIFAKMVAAAEGAAQGTQTKMEYEVINGVYNLLPNETLSRIMYKNLQMVGGLKYSPEETKFAQDIIKTFPSGVITSPEDAQKIAPFEVNEKGSGGSTDVGDVSWLVPTAGLNVATWVPGTSAHTWQAVAAGGTSIGQKGMMIAAKTLALTASDIFKNPKVTAEAQAELKRRQGEGFKYDALVGDRTAPLDYRK